MTTILRVNALKVSEIRSACFGCLSARHGLITSTACGFYGSLHFVLFYLY